MTIELVQSGVHFRILDGPYIAGDKPTSLAITHVTKIIAGLDKLRAYAAKHLLDLYNDTWLDDDIGEVDQQEFVARLTNPTVTLYDEIGAAIVYFEDSDMFGGHFIEVVINNGKPTSAEIAG